MSGHAPAHRSNCQNCDTPLSGPYCPQCGQHDVDYHKSIGPLTEDALEGVLHFDGKFFKSVKYLFTRPGFLTTEFMAGRRTRYAHPLRFYIFASFLFFATRILTQPRSGGADDAANKAAVQARAKAAVDEVKAEVRDNPVLKDNPRVRQALDAATAAPVGAAAGEPHSSWGWLNGKIKAYNEDGDLDKKELSREIRHLLPTMLFLCMPLLAAVLKMVYGRSGRLYIEHLIFALHVMTLIFLASLLTDLAQAVAGLVGGGTENFVGFALFCLTAWLVYRSFRVVYGQGKGKTLLKIAIVSAAYGMILLLGMGAVSLASYYIVSREA
jgi:hypothetical protein